MPTQNTPQPAGAKGGAEGSAGDHPAALWIKEGHKRNLAEARSNKKSKGKDILNSM